MKRTMYEAARHTPKRGVGGSNPLGDVRKTAVNPFKDLTAVCFLSIKISFKIFFQDQAFAFFLISSFPEVTTMVTPRIINRIAMISCSPSTINTPVPALNA